MFGAEVDLTTSQINTKKRTEHESSISPEYLLIVAAVS